MIRVYESWITNVILTAVIYTINTEIIVEQKSDRILNHFTANVRPMADCVWNFGCIVHIRLVGVLIHGNRWIAAMEQPSRTNQPSSSWYRRGASIEKGQCHPCQLNDNQADSSKDKTIHIQHNKTIRFRYSKPKYQRSNRDEKQRQPPLHFVNRSNFDFHHSDLYSNLDKRWSDSQRMITKQQIAWRSARVPKIDSDTRPIVPFVSYIHVYLWIDVLNRHAIASYDVYNANCNNCS